MLLVSNTIHNLTIEMTENLMTHSFYDTCTSLTREQKIVCTQFLWSTLYIKKLTGCGFWNNSELCLNKFLYDLIAAGSELSKLASQSWNVFDISGITRLMVLLKCRVLDWSKVWCSESRVCLRGASTFVLSVLGGLGMEGEISKGKWF